MLLSSVWFSPLTFVIQEFFFLIFQYFELLGKFKFAG